MEIKKKKQKLMIILKTDKKIEKMKKLTILDIFTRH